MLLPQLIARMESCLKLNEAYQEQYRLVKERLESTPKGKQFDFNERNIFGKFDLFCRRLVKLIDMFQTVQQVQSLHFCVRVHMSLFQLVCLKQCLCLYVRVVFIPISRSLSLC